MPFDIQPNSECWRWSGRSDKAGYGLARLFGQGVGAHRISYLLFHGPLDPGEMVLHKCDNPGCVNPDHLMKGTAKDNSRDMAEKGRNKPGPAILPGADHSTAKLAENQALAIIRSKAKGTELAAMYGVSTATISKIRNGKLWGHLKRHLPEK